MLAFTPMQGVKLTRKKINIARGELPKKKLQGEKQNSPTLQEGLSLFTRH
jgi:hypothetical protein